ncbi:protein of unknown function [Aminobacter niigataensis]|nr:protein of unknown function [Aminobacter niigataensis]
MNLEHTPNGGPSENPSIGGNTAIAAIATAAKWLATEKSPPHPIVPHLRRQFGLSVVEATHAIREAQLIRARAA